MKHNLRLIVLAFLFASCQVAAREPVFCSPASVPAAATRTAICPAERPVESAARVRSWLPPGLPASETVVLAVPGYFADEVGTQRGVFDAAFFIVAPDGVLGFRGNTRPGSSGFNHSVGRWYPCLLPGEVRYRLGTYISPLSGERREALVDGYTKVRRDDGTVQSGRYGIHLHSGGPVAGGSVSSWGCQTMPSEDFTEFFSTLKRQGLKEVRYILLPWSPDRVRGAGSK